MRAYVMLTAKIQRPETLAKIKARTGLDGIEVYGPFDAVLEAEVDSIGELRRMVVEIDKMGVIQSTTTYVVAEQGKKRAARGKTFAYVLVDAAPGYVEKVHASVSEIQDVRKADIIFGPYDVIADVGVRNLEALNRVVRRILGMDYVLKTCTLISFPRR